MAQPQARATLTGQRAERKRRAIVAAAREVFLRDGFEVPIDAIAGAADVSKVTIYHHFGSKEDLFSIVIGEVIQQTLADTLDTAAQRLEEAEDPHEALLWITRAWVAETITPQAQALRRLVGRVQRQFPELGRAWSEGPGRFRAIITQALERFAARDQLRIPDIDLAVSQLYALTLYPHMVAYDSGTTLDPDRTEQLITVGVDMLLSYYHPAGRHRGTDTL